MSDDEGGAAPPAGVRLFVADLMAPRDGSDARIGRERLRAAGGAGLACLVISIAAAAVLALTGAPAALLGTAAGLVVLDILHLAVGRARSPHVRARLALARTLLASPLLLIAASLAQGPVAIAAVATLMALQWIAFAQLPILALVASVAVVGSAWLLTSSWEAALLACAASLAVIALSTHRAAGAFAAWSRHIGQDRVSEQARRFLDLVEDGGEGWFWETNADGALTYVSHSLAMELGRPPETLLGRSFAELLLVENGESGAPSLGFHLGARFPFDNVVVAPNGRPDAAWSVSGRPSFDEVGRFLGFRGMGTYLSAARAREITSSKAASHDSLTGLPNRARMQAMLDEALANAASRKEGCALFLIDLDRFKQVNDTLGHPAGDALLVEVAQRLSAALSGAGQAGRLGGDEFKAILPGLDEEGELAALAERTIRSLSAPYRIQGHRVTIGASIGIAIVRPGKTLAAALVKEADLALYSAKDAGRGTFRFFEPAMHAQSIERQVFENDLRQAVAKGQLRLVYQPVVSTAGEDLVGFEALLRWAHPTRGILSPADFLAVAEGNGIVVGLGEWVIRTACAEAAAWPEHLHLTVNLSPAQLRHDGLPAIVASALGASGLAPDRLVLDVTEEALQDDGGWLQERLSQLKGLSVRLAFDDFGLGGASLKSLKAAPLDIVKLHQSLIRSGLPQDSRARQVVKALRELTRALKVEMVAEGAETLEDLNLIREIECDSVQGFLFGRPLAPDDARRLAADAKPVNAQEASAARPPRHSLIRRAALLQGDDAHDVRVRNISTGGAMVECKADLPRGAVVALDLGEGMQLEAEIRWVQDGRLGLHFASAFDLARLGKTKKRATKAMQPDYLQSENSPDSPWAGRQERLTIREVRRTS